MISEKFDIEYEFKNVIELCTDFEQIINKNYEFDNFILVISIENHYNSDNTFLRICLKNDIHNKISKHGQITLIHKIIDIEKENEQYLIEQIVIESFKIQNELNKKFDFDFKIFDNRK